MPLARGRPESTPIMGQPGPVSSFGLAFRPRHQDRLVEVRGGPTPPQDSLPGHAYSYSSLSVGGPLCQFDQDQFSAPVEVHGLILLQTRLDVHCAAAGRVEGDKLAGKSCFHFAFTLKTLIRAFWRILAHFGALAELDGPSESARISSCNPLNPRGMWRRGWDCLRGAPAMRVCAARFFPRLLPATTAFKPVLRRGSRPTPSVGAREKFFNPQSPIPNPQWRRGWDSNPRNPCGLSGFQDRRNRL